MSTARVLSHQAMSERNKRVEGHISTESAWADEDLDLFSLTLLDSHRLSLPHSPRTLLYPPSLTMLSHTHRIVFAVIALCQIYPAAAFFRLGPGTLVQERVVSRLVLSSVES